MTPLIGGIGLRNETQRADQEKHAAARAARAKEESDRRVSADLAALALRREAIMTALLAPLMSHSHRVSRSEAEGFVASARAWADAIMEAAK
jgi:hypothetical protein